MPMTSSGASRQFQWRDRCGLAWDVDIYDDGALISWIARPRYVGGHYMAHVQTHAHDSQRQLPMAYLLDVEVNERMENRGAGSMLVGQAIEECKRRGHEGIEGEISFVDSDHIDKLKYFYEKMGFSFVTYDSEHPKYGSTRVGKIEMFFSLP